MLLKNLSWIGKIVKIYEILLKKYILVGLWKILVGRDNFERSGKKIRNVREKISEKMYGKKFRGSKILATRGRGDFVKFYLAPPKCVFPLKCTPKFRDLAPPLETLHVNHLYINSIPLNIERDTCHIHKAWMLKDVIIYIWFKKSRSGWHRDYICTVRIK